MAETVDLSFIAANSMPEPNSGCWLWTLSYNREGYGRFGNKAVLAHRIAYQAAYGAIPAGAVVRHHCDNRACVNPGHLAAGTVNENVADRVRRGRGAFGARQHMAKLNDEIVRDIKRQLAEGASVTGLSKKYGVVQASISHIKIGRTWRHV
jgi:hypothetical protein